MAENYILGPHDPSRRRTLITPEGIDLSLGLASASQRFGAAMIDLLIMGGLLILFTIGIGFVLRGASLDRLLPWQEAVAIIWLLVSFLLRTSYFILFEGGRRAATFGKRLVKLRVVARSGERLTLDAVIARNLMREVEIYLPLTFLFYPANAGGPGTGLATWVASIWVLIFLLFPLFNRDRLRVGDLLAGTWVIMIPKRNLSYDLAAQGTREEAIRFTREQLDAYGVFELQTLEQVLREQNIDTLSMVAWTIRQKIDFWEPADDATFLQAYYAAARGHMERGLLFGKRRATKYDR